MLQFDELYDSIKVQSKKQPLYKMLLDKINSLRSEELKELKDKLNSEAFEDSSDFMLSWEYGMYKIPVIEEER